MNDKEKIKYIALHYGITAQMKQCIEESAELIQAISKYTKNYKDLDGGRIQIAEELADMTIMIDQIIYLFDCGYLVNTFRQDKIKRTIERINEDTKEVQLDGNN